MEADGVIQTVHPRKTWWDGVKQHMKSFAPQQSPEYVEKKNQGGNQLTQVHFKNGQ